ncbi:MAG: Eco29kI family restriction endonuclease [Phycisphaerales bacterium]|nr:Eco29kI family restriction endonuclease [Phycisphaerales bacterium]
MTNQLNIEKIGKLLQLLLEAIPDKLPAKEDLTTSRAKRLRGEVETLIAKLQQFAERLDPIRRPDFVFDPSNPEFVGQLIGRTLIEQPRHSLDELPKFYGSGVYAIYYRGAFAAYKPIKATETPIYVGKADPPTPDAKTVMDQGPKLCTRLKEHAKSIRAATSTLRIEDFYCRYLVVQSGWQKSAEDYLIHRFHPIWNQSICYGFGKHGDAPGTRANTRSPWDTLHPGRDWATRTGNKPNPCSPKEIMDLVAEHYRKHSRRV